MRTRAVLKICIVIGLFLGLGWGDRTYVSAQAEERRRVYATELSGDKPWSKAGIFWFGRVDPPGSPGRNSVDIRVGYNAEELSIFANVQDYYVWIDPESTPTSDLTQYDAVAVYLDTADDRATAPQLDDYLFLSGLGVGPNSRREARGTGAEWDFGWQAAWSAETGAGWFCNPGPNDNTCGVDAGWSSIFHIPWSALGFTGPPPHGSVWGLGVILYDRDDNPPAGFVAPEYWPETFAADNPSSWGEIAIGPPVYTPEPAVAEGQVVIRRGLQGSVEDSWVGGGGTCSGGQDGDPERDNHGGDTSLFVENQALIADFPCYSRSFLRFDLDAIPRDKVILSATLSLHHWGNANPSNAQPSLIWLLTVDGDWEEHTVTWNNAPLARENLTATWVGVCTPEDPCGFPGVRYDWDATQAVAEAVAVGSPLNVALYTADTNFDSSKYLSSSEAGDWNAVARPTLTVHWGARLATVRKEVSHVAPVHGRTVTYTLSLLGNGQALTLTDSLPTEVSEPGPIYVQGAGSADYNAGAHRVIWNGAPDVGRAVTITFPVTVQAAGPLAVFNTAVLTDAEGMVTSDTATMIVDAWRVWLPLLVRR